MADIFSKAKRSQVMARIRSRGNRDTELALLAILRRERITGWRRHRKITVEGPRLRVDGGKRKHPQRSTTHSQLAVRPDFVFPKRRTAIFVDGCFWHGCPLHATKPRNHAAFWRKKLAANRARDRKVGRALRAQGWKVLRIWEHELARKREAGLIRRIRRALPFQAPAHGAV